MVLERSRPSVTSSATPSASSWHRWVLWLVLLAGLPLLWSERNALMAWAAPQPHGVVLLIPDDNARAHPVTQAWLDAAQEEGLPLTPMTSDRFVHAVARRESITGVLVPDTVHRHASDVWVQALETHVRRGGHALLSFDSALFGLHQERYAAPASSCTSRSASRTAKQPPSSRSPPSGNSRHSNRGHPPDIRASPSVW